LIFTAAHPCSESESLLLYPAGVTRGTTAQVPASTMNCVMCVLCSLAGILIEPSLASHTSSCCFLRTVVWLQGLTHTEQHLPSLAHRLMHKVRTRYSALLRLPGCSTETIKAARLPLLATPPHLEAQMPGQVQHHPPCSCGTRFSSP